MKLVITLFLFLSCCFTIHGLHAGRAWSYPGKKFHSTEKSSPSARLNKSASADILDSDFLSREEEDEDLEKKHTLRIFALISQIYFDGKNNNSNIPLLYCHLALSAESCKYIKQRVLRI